MIKTPGSHTDRIAQACDRCRSKKIKCDGKRPHCSQCSTVGFECKTSDKLSRRAFPRGYTESLEDRVRQLETENNKLLNLLDIKDEQMEMLAKVESVNHTSPKIASPTTATTVKKAPSIHDEDEEEAYVVHQINTLLDDGSYKGSAAGGVFMEAFLEKLKTKNLPIFPQVAKLFENLDAHPQHSAPPASPDSLPTPSSMVASPGFEQQSSFFSTFAIPSRMTADKLTSTYFHEWNTVFAVLDQYAYLEEYQSVMNLLASAEATNNFDALKGKEMFLIVALLVLSLGSLASKDKSSHAMAESAKLEQDWQRALTAQLQTTPTLATVQALVLAELYSLHTGNMDNVWHYRMMAVSMTQRLGLHRCHKSLKLPNGSRLSFYDQEMRRRLFWVTYSLDCFSAAQLGAPRLLGDSDIECALPLNIDDELLRGEAAPENEGAMTQMSCPLSVIHFSKCLANILETIYSSSIETHPYKTVVMLEDQLESWRRELPSDLKFNFANGAPTAVLAPVHQKSPLLLMFYHYARILIHMPAISAPSLGTNAGTRGSASCVAVMQSAKILIQVGNYLKARSVIPTIPLNPSRANVFFGALVLYGAIDYSKGGALLSDIKRVMSSAMSHLYSDVQLRRPGALTPESFQRFEDICDTLLNVVNRKASDAAGSLVHVEEKVKGGPRKRRTSTKQRESMTIPQLTPPPAVLEEDHHESSRKSNAYVSLRDNAINDLLFLNSIASSSTNTNKQQQLNSGSSRNKQQQDRTQDRRRSSSSSSTSSSSSSSAFAHMNSIDMFDFVTRAPFQGGQGQAQTPGLISEDNNLLSLSFSYDEPLSPEDDIQHHQNQIQSQQQTQGGHGEEDEMGMPHAVDLLEFLNSNWADERSTISL